MDQSVPERPYFFVSYVHDGDGDDALVARFHTDLSTDVRLYAGLRPTARVGYCDTDSTVGFQWSPVLVEAVRTARVFLAMCSPTYFTSVACGKEWTIFELRLSSAGAAGRAGSPLIPLFWVPMERPDMDDVALRYQFRDPTFGAAYEKFGIRDLMRLRDNADAYKTFVTALAKRVVQLARTNLVAGVQRQRFEDVRPAFRRLAPQAEPATPPVPAQPSHPSASVSTTQLPRLNPTDPSHGPPISESLSRNTDQGPITCGEGESR